MQLASSGISNSFEYELIDCENLDDRIGWLEGVTGGKVTKGYRADYRSSGTLVLDNVSELPDRCAVRIWHTARLGEESARSMLTTLFPEPQSSRLERGRRKGSVRLYGPLKALGGDILGGGARGIAAGTNIKEHFEKRVRGSFRTPLVQAFAASASFGSYHVWEPGTSVLTECHATADACNGYVDDDAQGHVVLRPYAPPASIAPSFAIAQGAASLVLRGVDVESPEIVNKVVCAHESQSNGASSWVVRSAQVGAEHPWHPSRIGSWHAVSEHPPAIPEGADVGAVLQAYADQRLRELSDTRRTFSATMLYDPAVQVGTVGRFAYRDSADGEVLDVLCFVSQREIELDAAMRTQLTLEEV